MFLSQHVASLPVLHFVFLLSLHLLYQPFVQTPKEGGWGGILNTPASPSVNILVHISNNAATFLSHRAHSEAL